MTTKAKNKLAVKEFMKAFVPEMKRLGLETIIIEYNGGGDEGQIEDWNFSFRKGATKVDSKTLNEELVRVPQFVQGKHDSSYNYAYTVGEPKFIKLGDAIDSFAYEFLDMMGYGGWGEGNGSNGTITLNSTTGKVNLVHNWVVEEHETEEEFI